MRYLFPAGILLALVVTGVVPSTASAYTEWPAISTKVTTLATDEELPLKCDLESHVGNIRFLAQVHDFRKFMRFMVDLGQYLGETTNAGPNYILRVHFADQVIGITLAELSAFRFLKKPGHAADPKLLYDFFSRFESR